jgi:glycosyltransferase involved in cell wall biosynthesis
MKVLHVVTDRDRRGAQLFAADLSDALTQRGLTSQVVALVEGGDSYPLPFDVLGSGRYSLATLRSLRRLMRTADVTVAHGSDTVAACAVASVGTDSRYVVRQISDVRFWTSQPLRRLRSTILHRRPVSVVALSNFDRNELINVLKVPSDHIAVIPNGVDGTHFIPGGPEEASVRGSSDATGLSPLRLLFVGALTSEKGAEKLIEAIDGVQGVTLQIAGDGPTADQVRRSVARRSLGNVELLGRVTDVAELYRNADVVVLPCIGGDSMPACLIEAGMSGLPSIASRVGAISEIVLHEKTGLLVDPGDVAGLRNALVWMRDNRAILATMGASAERHCRAEFDIPLVADRWVQHLESLL